MSLLKTASVLGAVLITWPSWACDLSIDNADALNDKIASYFDRAFALSCDRRDEGLNCNVPGKQINFVIDRHPSLSVVVLSAGADKDSLGNLRELWNEVRLHLQFGKFEKPSEIAVEQAIEGRGPRIFIVQDHCGLVVHHSAAGSAFTLSGGWRK